MIPVSLPKISDEEKQAVMRVLDSGMLAQGKEVEALESIFSKFCDTKFSVATSNGTASLHTALFAAGIKPGDEVICPVFTFVATANSILMCGATPVFVDVDERTYNIDPQKVLEAITPKTKAISVVNLYGQCADYDELKKIAKENNLLIIEDAAQSVGATFNGVKSGKIGDVNSFSFYATKNIMCGEGGMVTTDNPDFARRALLFRQHGQDGKVKYEYHMLGYNYRMTEMQAAIANVQMKSVDKFTNQRIENAQKYYEGLKDINGIILPHVDERCKHVFHQYSIRITDKFKINRDEFAKYLEENGIGYGIYYPKSLNRYDHLKEFGRFDYRVSDILCNEIISIPVHPLLTADEIQFIIDKIHAI